jgi:hypothetical protein
VTEEVATQICLWWPDAVQLRARHPMAERMPTRLVCEAGPRIELPVSVPRPAAPKFAATAAAVLPLESSCITWTGTALMPSHLLKVQLLRGQLEQDPGGISFGSQDKFLELAAMERNGSLLGLR